MKPLQAHEQLLLLVAVQFVRVADQHALAQIHMGRLLRRQQIQARLPARQIAVALGVLQAMRQSGWQVVQPVRQAGVVQGLVEGGIIDHACATIEPKLRH